MNLQNIFAAENVRVSKPTNEGITNDPGFLVKEHPELYVTPWEVTRQRFLKLRHALI